MADWRAIVAAGVLLRLVAFWFVGETLPVLDEVDYHARAARAAEGRFILAEGKRAPASIALYRGVYRVFGVDARHARAVNVLVSALSIAAVGALGRRFGGDSAGLTAAALAAAYPNLVFFAFSLWTESLYLTIALGATLLLVPGRPSLLAVAGAGGLMGIAGLTREVGTVLPVFGCLWLLGRSGFRRRRAWGEAGLLGAAFVAVVLPWTLRINRESDGFALVTHTRWMNLYLGNVPQEDLPKHREDLPPYRAYEALGRTLEEREAAARPLVLAAIRDRMPLWPLEKTAEMVPRLLTPNSLPVQRLLLRRDDPGIRPRSAYVSRVDGTPLEPRREILAYVAVGGWVLLLVAGTAGLVLSWGRPLSGMLLLFLGLHLVPPIVTFGMSRFRLPVVPVVPDRGGVADPGGGSCLAGGRGDAEGGGRGHGARGSRGDGLQVVQVQGPHGG